MPQPGQERVVSDRMQTVTMIGSDGQPHAVEERARMFQVWSDIHGWTQPRTDLTYRHSASGDAVVCIDPSAGKFEVLHRTPKLILTLGD